jgi:hypothetical protein
LTPSRLGAKWRHFAAVTGSPLFGGDDGKKRGGDDEEKGGEDRKNGPGKTRRRKAGKKKTEKAPPGWQ